MSRLIDADALRESIITRQTEMSYEDAWALTCVDNAPTIEPQQWIPVSEQLPELYKPVLVTGGDIIWICELIESPDLDDGEFQWEDKMLGHWYSFDNWDAWCPLPEPYKEEKQ